MIPSRDEDQRLRRKKAARSLADYPLGTRVRFIESEAPRAFRRYGSKVATVVTRNLVDGEVGLTFGWSGKRTDDVLRWSGGEALVWAVPRELEIVPPRNHSTR